MKDNNKITKFRLLLRKISRRLRSSFGSFFCDEKIKKILKSNRPLSPKDHKLPNNLIVSLTSFDKRFETLPLTLECLLSQTIKPDKIILWISHSDKSDLTDDIKKFKNRGLEIRFCEEIRSYKKIIPALKKFPSSFIVTADDDAYYWPTWLEELVSSWSGEKSEIVAHRVRRVQIDNSNKIEKYSSWVVNSENTLEKSPLNFATGVGGVLYPPNSLHSDVIFKDIFQEKCSGADDVWLYWMARLQGSQVKRTGSEIDLLNWPRSQKEPLGDKNFHRNSNDEKIQKMIKEYGAVFN